MVVKGQVAVTGIRELNDFLKQLPIQINHRVIGAANVEAAKPLVDAAKSLAPKGKTKNLVNSIGAVKIPITKATEIGTVHVRPRVKAGYKGFHGHLVELGVVNRPAGGWYARMPGAHPTNQPPKPFMRPAFEATKDKLFQKFDDIFSNKLRDVMRRTLNKKKLWIP